jgi:uncharacterized protein YukE
MDLCDEIPRYSQRIWSEGLGDLSSSPLPELLDDFRRVYEDYKVYRSKCYGVHGADLYEYCSGIFSVALLKLSTAIEDKVRGREVSDEYVRFAIDMFTHDEKNVIREFERFNGLDTDSRVLAEMIVARRGEVYELVKEAVAKQYVDFANVVKTWTEQLKIRDSVRKGLINKYKARFKKVVEAFKILIEQQPAWLTRLFSEYEEALLASAEVRSLFEKRLGEVYEKELKLYSERLQSLEREREELLNKLSSLSERVASMEVDRSELEKELTKLREEYEGLSRRYHDVIAGWEERTKELEELKKKLIEKEKELMEMAEKERENTASREMLESEVFRLRNLVASYEDRLRKQEEEKEKILLELESLRSKAALIERVSKGEVKGRYVSPEETVLLEHIFIEKFRSKMGDLPLKIMAPWGEVVIEKWSREEYLSETGSPTHALPENKAVMFKHVSKKFMRFGEERVIELWAIYLSHLETLKSQGFDIQPATLSDLVKVLKTRIPEERRGDREFIIVGIASPTGWDDNIYKYVSGEEYSLVLGNKVIILVDLHENRVIYPEKLSKTMPSIDRIARFFLPEINVEEELRVNEVIKDLCMEKIAVGGVPYFTSDELLDKSRKFPDLLRIRVLHRLESEGMIRREKVGGRLVYRCKEGW